MSIIAQNKGLTENVLGDDKKHILLKLRELVEENLELSAFQVSDEYLLQFLYWTAFDIPDTIEKMKTFQNNLIKYSKWYATNPPIEMKSKIEKKFACILDTRDREGRAIIVLKVANLDFNDSLEDHTSTFELMFDYGHIQAETRENGVSIILDMENLSWKVLKWLTPTNILTEVELINTYPCKDIKMHIIKTSFVLDIAIKIVWPLLPANIKKMVKFHFNDWSSLHEFIIPENLPGEYGGSGLDINFEYYFTKLYEQNDEMKERLKYRSAIISKGC